MQTSTAAGRNVAAFSSRHVSVTAVFLKMFVSNIMLDTHAKNDWA